jgi:hypothetical protein
MPHYQQAAFPDAVRGRVVSAWDMTTGAAQPLGGLLIGPSLAFLGIEKTYLWMGLAISLLSGLALLSRSFRTAVIPAPA